MRKGPTTGAPGFDTPATTVLTFNDRYVFPKYPPR